MSTLTRQLLGPYLHADPGAGGGGAPTSPTAPAPDEPSAGVTDVDWSALNPDDPGTDDTDEPSAQDLEPPPAQPAPAAQPSAQPAPATPSPPAAAPAAPAPVAAPPSPPAPAAPPPAPSVSKEEQEKAQRELQKKITDTLAERYTAQISEDDARELAVNPEKVIPRLMAQAVLDAVSTVQGLMQQQLPQTVADVTSRAQAVAEAKKDFFAVNEDLAKPEYAKVLDAASAAFRAANPNADRKAIIEGVGRTARAMLGLPPKEATTTPAPTTTPPNEPPPTNPGAFRPVAAGGANRPAPAARPKSVWDEMIED
jgi:hypothetical protein